MYSGLAYVYGWLINALFRLGLYRGILLLRKLAVLPQHSRVIGSWAWTYQAAVERQQLRTSEGSLHGVSVGID